MKQSQDQIEFNYFEKVNQSVIVASTNLEYQQIDEKINVEMQDEIEKNQKKRRGKKRKENPNASPKTGMCLRSKKRKLN